MNRLLILGAIRHGRRLRCSKGCQEGPALSSKNMETICIPNTTAYYLRYVICIMAMHNMHVAYTNYVTCILLVLYVTALPMEP